MTKREKEQLRFYLKKLQSIIDYLESQNNDDAYRLSKQLANEIAYYISVDGKLERN